VEWVLLLGDSFSVDFVGVYILLGEMLMKDFIRSKLVLTLCTLVMLVSAVAIPLSGKIIHSHAAATSSQASWNIVSSPNIGTGENRLSGVSGVSANDIWSVGSSQNNGVRQTLTEHWNGGTWTANNPAPQNIGSYDNWLSGVAALSSNNVWAVGFYFDSLNSMHTLLENYNGTSWSAQTIGLGDLQGITKVSSTEAWAIGNYGGHPQFAHLVNGSWTLQSDNTNYANLYAITAVSSTNVIAVGFSYQGPIAYFWNGTGWSQTNPSGSGALLAVYALDATHIYAVGNTASNYDQGMLTMWNGSSWSSPLTVPITGYSDISSFSGVYALSASDVWLVGFQGLIEQYDGTNLYKVSSGSSGGESFFNGITMDPATGHGWAVGLDTVNGSVKTLIEQYTPSPSPSPTPTPTDTPSPTPTPTFTPTPSPSPTPAPRGKLFIFLPGISTHLNSGDVLESEDGNFGDFNTTLDTIQNIRGFVNSRAIFYSYTGSTSNGLPKPYTCQDTFTHSVMDDVMSLNAEIAQYPNTDIYLIGHSLGGVVAYSYLTALTENVAGVSLPANSQLKAVVTLDSPIGGVPARDYFALADVLFAQGIPSRLIPARCATLDDLPLTSVLNLEDIYANAKPGDPQGANASILRGIFRGADITNEELAEQAKQKLGTAILTVGNTNDFLWNPQPCLDSFINAALLTNLHVPDFITTQWLKDEGDTSGIYGRSFTTEGGCNLFTVRNGLNHLEVLNNQTVRKGLKNFLTPIVGGTPSPLRPEPPPINPSPPFIPIPVGTPPRR